MAIRNRACSLLGAALLAGCASNPTAVAGHSGPAYDAVIHVADAARAGGDLNTAVGLYRKASSLAPGEVAPVLALAQTLLDLGQTNDAITAYQSAVKLSGNDGDALRGLANAYLAAGRPDLAREPLTTALGHAPNDTKLLSALGVASDLTGAHKAAQGYYRTGLAADPMDGALANNLALSLALTANYDQAIAVLKPVADSAGSTSRERQTLSLIYGLSGSRDAAARYARMDLDEAATAHNLAFFDTLRGLPPDARTRSLSAATWAAPRQLTLTSITN